MASRPCWSYYTSRTLPPTQESYRTRDFQPPIPVAGGRQLWTLVASWTHKTSWLGIGVNGAHYTRVLFLQFWQSCLKNIISFPFSNIIGLWNLLSCLVMSFWYTLKAHERMDGTLQSRWKTYFSLRSAHQILCSTSFSGLSLITWNEHVKLFLAQRFFFLINNTSSNCNISSRGGVIFMISHNFL